MSDKRPVFHRVGPDGKVHTIHRRNPHASGQHEGHHHSHEQKKDAYYDRDLNRWVFPDSPAIAEENTFDRRASMVHPVKELNLKRFIAEKTHLITGEMENVIKHLEQEQEKARRALQQYTEELRKLDEMKWNDLKDFDDVGNWYSHNHGKLHF